MRKASILKQPATKLQCRSFRMDDKDSNSGHLVSLIHITQKWDICGFRAKTQTRSISVVEPAALNELFELMWLHWENVSEALSCSQP